jgi:hypothetical protein
MKTCQQVTYEEKQVTIYETVFEEVVEKKVVATTKFVADTELRVVPTVVYQDQQPACGACAPACGPAVSCCKVPVCCLQKLPHPIVREVPAEEVVTVKRVVEKKIPKTITCLTPKVTCVQVPVQSCCQSACSCGCGH